LKKDTPFVWSVDCNEAFKTLIKALTSYPILRQPDMSKMFTIHTDASMYALGAILTQHDNEGNEYVVAYASRSLKGGELNFGITAKEGLAVWWACKVFYPYIDGVEFDIVTDHSALIQKSRDQSSVRINNNLEKKILVVED
jgi:hypothetical protein